MTDTRETSPFNQTFDQLPATLGIFPLPGAVVFPRGVLELNIFEPRYLNLVCDSMRNTQLIGMIQPQDQQTSGQLHTVGCAARVIRYAETSDGRLEIQLQGLCRFSILEELTSMRGYRLIRPQWQAYKDDFSKHDVIDTSLQLLFSKTLIDYFNKRDLNVDWASIKNAPIEALVNNLAGQLAISTGDKQRLIEAQSLDDRIKTFIAIITEDEHSTETRH